MYTAADARQKDKAALDERIKHSVINHRQGNGAYLRVYSDDWFIDDIVNQLTRRGFINVVKPHIVLSGDVYFEWPVDADKIVETNTEKFINWCSRNKDKLMYGMSEEESTEFNRLYVKLFDTHE